MLHDLTAGISQWLPYGSVEVGGPKQLKTADKPLQPEAESAAD